MKINRREFLGGAAAFSAPFLFGGCASKCAAADKINIGVVGLGRIAITMDMPNVIKHHNLARITAVCDLDSNRLANGKKFVEEKYNKALGTTGYTVKTFATLTEMLANADLDAVMICLPDHWHALAASECLIAKKHIWLQKPFAQTIQEGRCIANLAKMNNCVVQVGSWQRSVMQFHRVCELVRNGRIGAIKQVEVGIGLDKAGGSSAIQPVPANLNYEMWLGPTDENAPYNETRVHTQNLARIGDRPGWIQLEPYGWGMITNWGAHHLDIVNWGLGRDPDEVSGTCQWMDTTGGKLWNAHTTYDLHYKYGAADVHVCNKYPMGVKFIGENGDWLYCQRGAAKVTPSDPDVPANGKMQPLMASKNKLLEPIANPTVALKTSNDHWLNWLEGIKLGDPNYTVTNAEGGHHSTAGCSLGHMCMKLNKTIKWDATKETTGDAAADKLMTPFARGKYDLKKLLSANGLDYNKLIHI